MADGPPLLHRGTASFSLRRLVRFLVTTGLLVLLAGILWPLAPQGAAGTRQDAESFYLKMQVFERALKNGHYLDQVFTEQEINGYFAETLKNTPQAVSNSTATLKLQAIRFQLLPGSFTVLILAGLGPIQLSYRIDAEPLPPDNGRGFDIRIRRAHWGHIPLPPQPAQWMAERIGKIFSRMKRERAILDHATRLTVEAGNLSLGIGKEEVEESAP